MVEGKVNRESLSHVWFHKCIVYLLTDVNIDLQIHRQITGQQSISVSAQLEKLLHISVSDLSLDPCMEEDIFVSGALLQVKPNDTEFLS